ncbi:MAG: hypothetical protein R3F31_08110 [Verrucomicrobiales bacterium]
MSGPLWWTNLRWAKGVSNPATYTGVFGLIRDLFAQLPLSRTRGYGPGRFSFNVAGGRCEVCKGDGSLRIDMHFLSDVYVTCDSCNGRRFNRETLDVTYRGMSIADILEMPVEEAVKFFQNIPGIHQRVRTLRDVGLGYIALDSRGTTLSGGEAQRVKLATELGKTTVKRFTCSTSPPQGCIWRTSPSLMGVLGKLRDQGATVILIEHQIDVIQGADWIVDPGTGRWGPWRTTGGRRFPRRRESLPGEFDGAILAEIHGSGPVA